MSPHLIHLARGGSDSNNDNMLNSSKIIISIDKMIMTTFQHSTLYFTFIHLRSHKMAKIPKLQLIKQ